MADDTAKKLSAAKSALSNAAKFTKSVEGSEKSMFAPKPAAPKPVATAPKPAMPANPQGDVGKELADKARNVSQYGEGVPKMHDGGVAKKDGLHDLQKGEVVLTKDQAKKSKVKDLMTKDEPKKEKESGSKESKEKKEPSAKKESKGKKVQHKHTHIEHHYDANGKPTGHTVRHTPVEGGQEVSYAAPDLDGVHDGLEENIGGAGQEEPQESEE